MTDEVKNKLRLLHLGKSKSEEHKKKMRVPKSEEHKKKTSETHADVSGENNPMFGKKHSSETIEKQSVIKKGNQYSKGSKRTNESRALISLNNSNTGLTGLKHPTSRSYSLVNEELQTTIILSHSEVVRWCRENKVSYALLYKEFKNEIDLQSPRTQNWKLRLTK